MFSMAKFKKMAPKVLPAKWMLLLFAAMLLFAWQMCASYQRSADIKKQLQDKNTKKI
jgi:hypothetical protein